MIIFANIIVILLLLNTFFFIRMLRGGYINDQFHKWAKEEINKAENIEEMEYSTDVYCCFSVDEFIFLKPNVWDFESVLEYCKKKYEDGVK